MRNMIPVFALGALLTVMASAADIPAQLSLVVGDVEVNRSGVINKGTLSMPLQVADVVTAKAESYCEVKFSNQSLVRIEANSSMRIDRKDETKDRKVTRLFILLGEIVAKVTKMGKRDVYEVRTNSAQAFVRGTIFKLKVEEDGSSLFSIFEGKLGVKSLVQGAKELLVDNNFQGKITAGQLAPVVNKISVQELQKFHTTFKEFLDRSAMLEKALKDLQKKINDNKYIKGAKKSCLF